MLFRSYSLLLAKQLGYGKHFSLTYLLTYPLTHLLTYLLTCRQPRNVVIVEALRNVCGLTLLRDYEDYNEFNIRQFQFKITGIEPVGNSNSNSNNNKPATTAEGNPEGVAEGTSE